MSTQAQTPTQPLPTWDEILDYEVKVKEILTARLKEILPEDVEIADVSFTVMEADNKHYEERVEITLDVTRYLGLNVECLWWEGAYYNCQDGISQNASDYPECDPESPQYNEDKCMKVVEDCVNSQLEDFKNNYCGLPFAFGWTNFVTSVAYIRTWESEDSSKYCCGVELVYTYRQRPFKTAMRDIMASDNATRVLVEQVVSEIQRVLEALKALAP